MKKIDKQLGKDLKSANSETIIGAVKEIRNKGNLAYIHPLADVLKDNKDESVIKEVTSVFNDLHDQESADKIIEIIKDDNYKKIKKTMITSCWQNGIHFHSYFTLFVDFVINEDFETAIEAFSVIDDMENKISKDKLIEGKQMIKAAFDHSYDDKLKLIKELYKHIDHLLDEITFNS